MLLAVATVDYAVLGICLLVMLGIGVWAARGQKESEDFLLAGRALRWWPLGPSLVLAGLMAVYYCGIPNQAYSVGLKLLLVPVLVWATVPLLFGCVIPLCHRLRLESIYEYLELRFDPATQTIASGSFIVWQLFWLAGVMCVPLAVFRPAGGPDVPVWAILIAVGATATLYTFLGGMKAVVWTDLVQLLLMAAATLLVIFAVWAHLDEGPGRIWEVAEKLGRTKILDTSRDLSADWSVWAVVPYLILVPMFFYVADQATVQRLLAAEESGQMKGSFLTGSALICLLVSMLVYAGLGLLTVYHDHAQTELPPYWVVNTARDPETGRPLIGPDTVIDAETVGQLVAEGAILDPNTNRPMTDTEELIDAEGRVSIDRLATREITGERRLRAGSDELFARFVDRHLPAGLVGLVLAALLAAVMATVDSGLTAITTLLVVDFHRRLGWAERGLARFRGKTPGELDQTDELWLARPLVLVLGATVTLLALAASQVADVFGFLALLLNCFAGPLLGIFLLGLFTRRATGPAALAGAAIGGLAALWLTLGHHLAASYSTLGWQWPWDKPLGACWPLPCGLAVTLLVGYTLSFLPAKRKSRQELAGLVLGLGPWGVLAETEDDWEEDENDQDTLDWVKTEFDPNEPNQPGPWR